MSLTQNRLVATSYRFRSSATLADIAIGAQDAAPNKATHSPGWGTALDSNEPVRLFGSEPVIGVIEVVNEGPAHQALALRLYWWEYSEAQQNALGLDHRAHEAFRLRAVDVVITPSVLRGHLSVYAITRTADVLEDTVLPAIIELIGTVDEEATLLDGESDLLVDDADFYLWMIDLGRRSAPISGNYELDEIRVVESKDASLRGTALSEGVDTSRFEMLTLIALVGATFGPAKIKVRDTSSLANYDFELTAAGTLAIQTGETYIPETVLRADIGYRAFFDVALSIIPALLTAYRRDRTWGNEGRDDFIRFCRQQLSGPGITLTIAAVDIDESRTFYTEMLGFDSGGAGLALRAGAIRLIPDASCSEPTSFNITSLDAGSIRERLAAAGVPIRDLESSSERGVRFSVTDPGGNTIELSSE
ncbi:VOC family protein [Curtobacterium oceanosedimentum]|uniref:Uncharacterized protein n=1 Tax=Curtobacterium oceanosedimentum TaxID=465820 RepID=A0A147DRI3_9MICO|nr:hypothetical protein [Curtobacterium oceanosedimentum]KTR52031.1 hypothetical protein NS359_08040 [Curtobacterium oceanosedimentum]